MQRNAPCLPPPFVYGTLASGCIGQDDFFGLRLVLTSLITLKPLEHSESVEDQATCVKEFRKEYEEVEPMYKEMFKSYLEYAVAHEAVIQKFGRFPHRNEVLGRISTEAEKHHLESGGARW